MMSEGTKTLILAFTLKTGQSVGQHNRVKQTQNIIFLFYFFLSEGGTQPASVLGNADLWYNRSLLGQSAHHTSCRVDLNL